MRTLIVDGQIWQTNAFWRGMGGYAHNLIDSFAKQNPDTRIIVTLNSNMTNDDERIRAIQEKLPTAELQQLDLPFQPKPGVGEEERAIATLDNFISNTLSLESSEVFFFIPALFLFDYCAVFPTKAKKLLLFHDFTPLIFREDLAKYFPAHLYFPRFKHVFEADVVLANSATTAYDLEVYLGLSPDRIVTIDGSLVHAQGVSSSAREDTPVLRRLGLTDSKYLLMPTGGTEFKNNIRAAHAYRNLRAVLSVDIKLVLTSFFTDQEKSDLQLIADNSLIFSGNNTPSEQMELFAHCEAVVLPSLYEGLGIPVLEGIEHQKPVACSDIAVFREIPHCQEALYMFDPLDIEQMSEMMLRAAAQAGFDQKAQYYEEILTKYSWERTAKLFSQALNQKTRFLGRKKPTKKIAVTCPDPRKNNDVAVFAQRMYGHGLRVGIEFVYFIDPGGDDVIGDTVLPDYIRGIARCYDIDSLYDRLTQESFAEVVHFLSDDTRFIKLLRAALSTQGYIYIGNRDYSATIRALSEFGMQSTKQMEATTQLSNLVAGAHLFHSPALFGAAKGIVTEKHLSSDTKKTLKVFDLDTPTLQVPECSIVNFGNKRRSTQTQVYSEVLAFLEGKV
jgi:glycosyltransferase involved in cell wall biosynthesis